MLYPTIFSKNIKSWFSTKKDKNFKLWKNFSYCHQIHSDVVFEVTKPWLQWDWDAIWTKNYSDKNSLSPLICAIRVADCVPILFERKNDETYIIWAIHSWREWTTKNIVRKVFWNIKTKNQNLQVENLKVRIWPSICQNCYEFWNEAENLFNTKYIKIWKNDKFLVDISWIVINQMLEYWVSKNNIEISNECTYKNDELFWSWRRWKDTWRMIARIGFEG